ncbi:MAG: hypothetical protein WCJ33_03285 [Pseudomonadota bacterium]
MKYKLLWDEGALDDLKKIGKSEATRIIKKVESYLVKNPTLPFLKD